MHNLTGKPAEGDDFFDRERETRRLWERIDTDNVLLLAPRRVGKTSLMFRLRDGAEREGFHAAYVSVADVTTEIGFVERLYEAAQKLAPAKKAIRHIAKGPLGRFLRRIKKLGLFSISSWLIPFHLQLFFATLREHVSDRRPKSNKITTADVDGVYEQLLSPAKRAYFDYWEQRLHEELGSPDDRQSIDLIDVIAKNPEGESVAILKSVLDKHFQDGAQRDDKLRYLLDVLQADGYIVETGGRFIFRSSLLRDFWLRRVSL